MRFLSGTFVLLLTVAPVIAQTAPSAEDGTVLTAAVRKAVGARLAQDYLDAAKQAGLQSRATSAFARRLENGSIDHRMLMAAVAEKENEIRIAREKDKGNERTAEVTQQRRSPIINSPKASQANVLNPPADKPAATARDDDAQIKEAEASLLIRIMRLMNNYVAEFPVVRISVQPAPPHDYAIEINGEQLSPSTKNEYRVATGALQVMVRRANKPNCAFKGVAQPKRPVTVACAL